MSTATPRGWSRPVNGSIGLGGRARPPASAPDLPHSVGDVEVAGGVHRHTFGLVEAGKRQLDLGGRSTPTGRSLPPEARPGHLGDGRWPIAAGQCGMAGLSAFAEGRSSASAAGS